MANLYVTTRQTTQSGTATNIATVSGRDNDEALLKAKIKAYRTMEVFMNEKTMVDAFVGVTDLEMGINYVSEHWVKEVEPTTEEVTE